MSKSLGNVIDPSVGIEEKSKEEPACRLMCCAAMGIISRLLLRHSD